MTKVLGSKLGALWTRINTILVPRQATVSSGEGYHTVTLQNCNTPTPDALVSFNIPASSDGATIDDIAAMINSAYEDGGSDISAEVMDVDKLSLFIEKDNDTKTSWYGTSSASATTTAKAVSCSGYTLRAGNTITILFTYQNTAVAPTLNINSTGAKSIYVNNAIASSTNPCMWPAYTLVDFIYDGTYYRYLGQHRGGKSYYGTCATTTQTLVGTCADFELTKGVLITLQMTAENINKAAAKTLNVNFTGAKTVYVGNAATSTTNTLIWNNGEILQFIYDGSYWRFIGRSNNKSITEQFADGLANGDTNLILEDYDSNYLALYAPDEVKISTTQPTASDTKLWVDPSTSSSSYGTYIKNYVKFTGTDSITAGMGNNMVYMIGFSETSVANSDLAVLNGDGLITIQKTGFYLIIYHYNFLQSTNTNNTISGILFTNATSPNGYDISGNEAAHNVDYIYTGNIGYSKALVTTAQLTAGTIIGGGLWLSQGVTSATTNLSACSMTLIHLNDQILI